MDNYSHHVHPVVQQLATKTEILPVKEDADKTPTACLSDNTLGVALGQITGGGEYGDALSKI